MVQQALEEAATDDERAAIAREFHGKAVQAAKCMNANHVIQKCIMVCSPQSLQFVIDELVALGDGLSKMAKDKYGCRVLQRLMEHCRPEQLRRMSDRLIHEGAELAGHIFGTYVVQCIMEHGEEEGKRRLACVLACHAATLGSSPHGAAALSAALTHSSEEDQVELARALVRHRELLVLMARTRRGHCAVPRVLELLGEEGAQAACRLRQDQGLLKRSRYGKAVAAHLAAEEGP